jgi:putative transposase
MEMTMDRNKLKAMAAELAKDIKTEADLNALSAELLKLTVETALNAELTGHLGYNKHGDSKPARGNACNGSTPKTLKGQHGEVEILTPRDRDGSFESQIVRKNQTRLTRMDDRILNLYA